MIKVAIRAILAAACAAPSACKGPQQVRSLAAVQSRCQAPVDNGPASQLVPFCAACGNLTLPPRLSCIYDVSACNSLMPGATCQVKCRSPYTGMTTAATCPSGNSNAGLSLMYSLPTCSCPSPSAQEGYVALPDGSWVCAQGYLGTPSVMCSNSTYCVVPYLVGCNPLLPCAVPVVDTCRYDVSSCSAVRPGSSCSVACKAPFTGKTSAHCNPSNTDPTQALTYYPPVCGLSVCSDPSPIPQGYVKTSSGQWTCASGFQGQVVNRCAPGPNWSKDCQAVAVLSGCEMIVNCLAPVFSGMDSCMYDVSDCKSVIPGTYCQLPCKAPYTGSSNQGFCPPGNTNASGLLMNASGCVLQNCGDPVEVAAGYLRTDNGQGAAAVYACQQAYTGYAQQTCIIASGCVATAVLTGCEQLVPCKGSSNDCRYDMYNCGSVQPGGSCVVTCNAPFSGESATGTCMAGNTDTAGLVWSPPACVSTLTVCTDLSASTALAQGYVMGTNGLWMCAPGYAGSAVKTCVGEAASCKVTAIMSGCSLAVSCEPLALDGLSACMVNASSCQLVPSGGSCLARCQFVVPHYPSPSSIMSCPAANTVAGMNITGTLPSCGCGEPASLTPGYTRTSTDVYGYGVYECNAGWTGQAVKLCARAATGGCNIEPLLTGCGQPKPCQAAGFFDDGTTSAKLVSGTLKFGPAMVGSTINEVGLTGYNIFLMDTCGQLLGKAVIFVPVATSNQVLCCRTDAYIVSVRTAKLAGTAGLLIMPMTTAGHQSPTGLSVNISASLLARAGVSSAAADLRPFTWILLLMAFKACPSRS